MRTILSLAVEVLDQIVEKLDLCDQKSLRLTCSQINAASEPHVFSTIVISGRDTYKLVLLLKMLGAGKTSPVATHVRMLKLGPLFSRWTDLYGRPLYKRDGVAVAVEKYLLPTILSLERLNSVCWSLFSFEPTEQIQAIVSGLSSLRHLTNFSFRIDETSPHFWGQPTIPLYLDLKPLHSLLKITIFAPYTLHDSLREPLRTLITQSPELGSLSFEYTYNWIDWARSALLLSDILDGLPPCSLHTLELKEEMAPGIASVCMPHLYSLTTLHITHCRHPEKFFQLWPMLSSAHIFLKDLATSFLDHHSLNYMCSYTGLENLTFIFDKIDVAEAPSEAFSSRFFAQVLPMHADTLLELAVGTEACWQWLPAEWTFNHSNAPFVSQCTKLRRLSFRISDRPYENTILLLNTAATLPWLIYLRIKSSPNGVHTTYIQPWDMAILHYDPIAPSTFNPSLTVRCDDQVFRICTSDRGLRFVLRDPPKPSIFQPITGEEEARRVFAVSRWSRMRDWCSRSWYRLCRRRRS